MSFLYPLLWLGALGAAVPLWLHLRQKRPENLVAFSAVRFLEDQPRPKRGSFNLRDPLLFALRLLALLLLVTAFTWPYLKKAKPVVTVSRVHLLDNTLSQQAGDGFEGDREAVLRALGEAGPNTQDAVVVLTGQSTVVVGFSDDRESARQRLREFEPSHQRGSYLEAFRLASSLLEQSLGLEKEILVYGDYQENQWSQHQTSPPFLKDVQVTLVGEPVGEVLPNLALHEPRSRFFFLGDKTFVDLTVDLAHQGPVGEASVSAASVDVNAGGRSVMRRDFSLAGPSQVTTLRARWQTDPEQWLRGVVTVVGAGADSNQDALAADDRTYFCIPPIEAGRVALLVRSPYLRAALGPEVMQGRWRAERLDPTRVDPAAPLAELADVLVIEASYAQSEKIRQLVLRYLNNERGVVLLLDRMTPLVKGFLRELDLDVVDTAVDQQESQTFRYFNIYHPIFQPFAQGELGDLLTTQVHRHERLRSSSARPLIYGHSGGGLMAESLKTKGRLLIFTFGFNLEATDWPIQPSFIPFLDLTLQYARASTPLQTSWTPGDLYSVPVPEDQNVTRLLVYRESEEGDVEVLRRPVEPGDSQVRFRVPDLPGIYRVTWEAAPDMEPAQKSATPFLLLAVNPARDESHLVYQAEPEALAAWTLSTPDAAPPAAQALDFEIVPRAEILRQHIWWWLALLAFAALSIETGLLGFRKESS